MRLTVISGLCTAQVLAEVAEDCGLPPFGTRRQLARRLASLAAVGQAQQAQQQQQQQPAFGKPVTSISSSVSVLSPLQQDGDINGLESQKTAEEKTEEAVDGSSDRGWKRRFERQLEAQEVALADVGATQAAADNSRSWLESGMLGAMLPPREAAARIEGSKEKGSIEERAALLIQLRARGDPRRAEVLTRDLQRSSVLQKVVQPHQVRVCTCVFVEWCVVYD